MGRKIIAFIKKELSHFDRSDFPDMRRSVCEAIIIFLSISVLSGLFYAGAKALSSRPELMRYLIEACEEGVSVNYWIVLGTIGTILFGLFIVFPLHRIAQASCIIFYNVNSISAIIFGLIVSKMIYYLFSLPDKPWIETLDLVMTIIVIVLAVLYFTLFFWLMNYLTKQPGLIGKVRRTRLVIRIPVGIVFTPPLIWAYCKG
ncbi:MAG: hypothetical protein LBC79_06650 [Deltaproteobacteria bacterium]|jgi:hypothetical protein|nr:hypothetical protein [Deltaproteobacteria bacterium]